MHRTIIIVGAALLPLTSTASAQPVTISPEQIGQIFCIARLGNDMAPVEALLTAELTAAVAEAEAQNGIMANAHPDEKPPLGDGIPWQAFPDYADQCTPGNVILMTDQAAIAIAYAFAAYPDAAFTDTLKLKLVDGPDGWRVWRIDDVAYANDGTLRTVLSSAFLN